MKKEISLDLLTRTFDNLPIGICIFHIEDVNDIEKVQYVYANNILLYEMRKEKEEVFGNYIINVAPEAYAHEMGRKVIETYVNVAVTKESVNMGLVEYSNHMVAGTYELTVHHIVDHYIYVALRNVTELEQSKNELAEINKNMEKIVRERTAKLEFKNTEQEQFTYAISHDLQEPLGKIKSFIQLIENEKHPNLDKNTQNYLQIIFEAATHMSSLVNSLLDYNRLSRKTNPTEIDFNQLIERVLVDLNPLISKTKATFEIGELPQIMGYESELELLFYHLINNALKFQQPGIPPVIKVSAKKENGWTFTVEDNGMGIEEKYTDLIFSIFRKLHSHTEFEGTGIGLALCKKIIGFYGGNIWLESEVNKGSSFHFNLPE